MLKVAWAPIYHHPLPENHRFPMVKYSLLPEQLVHEGTLSEHSFFRPDMLTEKQITRTHCNSYWTDLKRLTLDGKAQRKIGFPLSKQLVDRERTICKGTIDNTGIRPEVWVFNEYRRWNTSCFL